jgi:hypothetical protein
MGRGANILVPASSSAPLDCARGGAGLGGELRGGEEPEVEAPSATGRAASPGGACMDVVRESEPLCEDVVAAAVFGTGPELLLVPCPRPIPCVPVIAISSLMAVAGVPGLAPHG